MRYIILNDDKTPAEKLSDGGYSKKRGSRYIDLTGQTFNRLTVTKDVGRDNQGGVLWECKCTCGNTHVCRGYDMKSGKIKSCGCLNRELAKERGGQNFKDLTGLTFGKLKVIEKTDRKQGHNYFWKCKCECGSTSYVSGGNLTSGKVKSCGCSIYEGVKGVVYLILDKKQMVCKIGLAKNIKHRFRTIQIANPNRLKLIGIKKTSKMALYEKEIHEQFKRQHIRGEWFKFTPEILEYFEEVDSI